MVNNKLDFELDLTNQHLSTGTHKISMWAIDESGNPSEILDKSILITNRGSQKAPSHFSTKPLCIRRILIFYNQANTKLETGKRIMNNTA